MKSEDLGELYEKRILSKTLNSEVLDKKILTEGLIYSYDYNLFLMRLKQSFGKYIVQSEAIPLIGSDEPYKTPTTVTIEFKPEIENFSEKLQEYLNFYGYFVVVKKTTENNNIFFQFEPKYPMELDEDIFKSFGVYHITYKNRLEKIKKTGLSPKETTTYFQHPSNRIYLFFTNIFKYVLFFKNILAESKQISPDEMIILKIKSLNSKIYLDESFQFNPPNYIAGFVLKNIHPNNIEVLEKTDN